MKQCTKCRQTLDLSAFRKHANGKDGIHAVCRYCERDYTQKYYRRNRTVILEKLKDNKQVKQYQAKRDELCQAEWLEYFSNKYGLDPCCSVCSKKLKWRSSNILESVHFDHRHGGQEMWQQPPKSFWQNRRCNSKNIEIWEQCDFGILCRRCNKSLPTIDREQWTKHVIKYVFGNNVGLLKLEKAELPLLDWEY